MANHLRRKYYLANFVFMLLFLFVLLFLNCLAAGDISEFDPLSKSVSNNEKVIVSGVPEAFCTEECQRDPLGFEAITALHSHLDEDHNGNIDLDEIEGFIHYELHISNGEKIERRERNILHGAQLASLLEMWNIWLKSPVRSWSPEEVADWLIIHVELPQYAKLFVTNRVSGLFLPRLAMDKHNFLQGLGVNSPVHRKKINLKAMDAVLFGSPRVPTLSMCDEECAKDREGCNALADLHKHLDDDNDGSVDTSETTEFIRDELAEDIGNRQKSFLNNKTKVTAKDIWCTWVNSTVRSWTVVEVVDWLVNHVELPQYAKNFEENNIDGHMLARIAADKLDSVGFFLKDQLGISSSKDRQKIRIKAQDFVLFGPPKFKFTLQILGALAFSLMVALIGFWYGFHGYQSHRKSVRYIAKMSKDLDDLKNAERKLRELQKKLCDKEKDEKEKSEKMLNHEDEIGETKEKLEKVRQALPQLQMWLQLTHEIERHNYSLKYQTAEKTLRNAKEACERINKKKLSLLGSFRIAHMSSVDDVDQRIINARQALYEVTNDLQERLTRWEQIEHLLGLPIRINPGADALRKALSVDEYLIASRRRGFSKSNLRSGSHDSDEDDSTSIFSGLDYGSQCAKSVLDKLPHVTASGSSNSLNSLVSRSNSSNNNSASPNGVRFQ